MKRQHRFRGVEIGGLITTLALTVAGCSGSAEADPTPSFESSSAEAEQTPDVTEPPYDTDLNLTEDEKKAADEAYQFLVEFNRAYNQVASEAGANPERELQYTEGEIREKHSEGWADMAEEGERSVGGVVHVFHHLKDIQVSVEGPNTAQFESCVDYRQLDVLDKDGNSVANPEREPKIVVYELRQRGTDWKLNDIEFADETCGA